MVDFIQGRELPTGTIAQQIGMSADGRVVREPASGTATRGDLTPAEVAIARLATTGQLTSFARSAVPRILLSSATAISATGAITGLTALPYTPSGVVVVYCFAQTGLAAGLYYARFSSTTACQLYTDAAGTVTPTGITAAAYAGGTSLAGLVTVAIPGGTLGPNGKINIGVRSSAYNSAGTKRVQWAFGSISTSMDVTTSGTIVATMWVENRGAQNVNLHGAGSGNDPLALGGLGYLNVSSAIQQGSLDTSVSQNVVLSGRNISAASSWVIIESYEIQIVYGA